MSNTLSSWSGRSLAVMLSLGLTACGPTEPPKPQPSVPGGPLVGECQEKPAYTEDVSACQALASDYRPRVNGSADDAWPVCISDDNAYHRVQPTISSIARVEAFEEMGKKLWASGHVPTAAEFVEARVFYAQDQGLDSRVQRREDIHYGAAANGARCSDAGIPEQYPDRCVGPAKLLPVLNDAFQRGANGEAPRVHAARIEAALLWFLYVSPLAEATSCADKPADCDSAWAYYTGGTERGQPLGLARYTREVGPETHERAYDGALALRCWRDLDTAVPAADVDMRDRARAQYDRAMLRGLALIARQRLSELACTTGGAKEAREAFLKVLLPLLDRAARERDAAKANVLKAQTEALSTGTVDVPAAVSALDALFSCP